MRESSPSFHTESAGMHVQFLIPADFARGRWCLPELMIGVRSAFLFFTIMISWIYLNIEPVRPVERIIISHLPLRSTALLTSGALRAPSPPPPPPTPPHVKKAGYNLVCSARRSFFFFCAHKEHRGCDWGSGSSAADRLLITMQKARIIINLCCSTSCRTNRAAPIGNAVADWESQPALSFSLAFCVLAFCPSADRLSHPKGTCMLSKI